MRATDLFKRLISIGYWSSPSEPWWPDPRSLVDPAWDAEEREGVFIHLKWGIAVRPFCGPSRCRLCGCPNGTLELTDGYYVWPEGLGHYVKEHSVRLPERFVAHVRSYYERIESLVIEEEWWRNEATRDEA